MPERTRFSSTTPSASPGKLPPPTSRSPSTSPLGCPTSSRPITRSSTKRPRRWTEPDSSCRRISPAQNASPPSASFRLWLLLSGVCAGQPWIWAGGVYYPGVGLGWSAGWGVAVEREQVVERLLGGGAVGEDAPGAGAALAAVVVEQDGLLDARQLSQQLTNRQVQPRLVGMAAQQVRDRQGQHAVEDVDADLLVGPVVHGAKRHHLGVLELAEPGFDLGLGAVGGHHLGGGPLVAVGEQDPLAEDAALQAPAGRLVGVPRQAEGGWRIAGEGGGDDVCDPARPQDRGDLALDSAAVTAGASACQAGPQLGQAALRLGQGLVQAARLGLLQGR